MSEPTITEVFGTGATVSATALTIPASFFTAYGLTIAPSTHAESCIIAFCLAFNNTLTETARTQDLVNRNVTVSYAGQDTISQSGNQYQRDVWSVVAYKSTPLNPVDPTQY